MEAEPNTNINAKNNTTGLNVKVRNSKTRLCYYKSQEQVIHLESLEQQPLVKYKNQEYSIAGQM